MLNAIVHVFICRYLSEFYETNSQSLKTIFYKFQSGY